MPGFFSLLDCIYFVVMLLVRRVVLGIYGKTTTHGTYVLDMFLIHLSADLESYFVETT